MTPTLQDFARIASTYGERLTRKWFESLTRTQQLALVAEARKRWIETRHAGPTT